MTAPVLYFAPMEGLTDGILRRTHARLFGGVDVYGIPFCRLTHTRTLTAREERDCAPEENAGLHALPQALTREPDQLLAWLGWIASLGYERADLNLGCPSPTVTRRGRGSALLGDFGALRRLLDAVFDAGLPVPLSVKTRIGVDDPEEWPDVLRVLRAYPFAHVTVHVRTAREQYAGGVHPEAFGAALDAFGERAVYNGDVRTPEDARALAARYPDMRGLMLGRGLLADPSLARQLRGGPAASRGELEAWYETLDAAWTERFGAVIALGRLKKLMAWPCEAMADPRRRRALRRARDAEACISALLG